MENIKFVRKIQGGFTLLGFISGIALLLQFMQLTFIKDANDQVSEQYIKPKNQIDKISTNFRSIQFIMLQMSMEEFESKFSGNYQNYETSKAVVDSSFGKLLRETNDESLKAEIETIQNIWGEYKFLVADAILSAAVTKNFMMAADIATTSGEELGGRMSDKFDQLINILQEKSDVLNANIDDNVNTAKYVTILTIVFGTLLYLICAFYLAPLISKPLNKIIKLVHSFALGDYNSELVKTSNDEIGELTESLIILHFRKLKRKRLRLQKK